MSKGPRPHSGHRHHRRRGSRTRQPGGAVRDYTRELEHALDVARHQLLVMREVYPALDYCARVYYCVRCRHIDIAAAPADDLPSDYACPACERPQEALSPVLDVQGVRAA